MRLERVGRAVVVVRHLLYLMSAFQTGKGESVSCRSRS